MRVVIDAYIINIFDVVFSLVGKAKEVAIWDVRVYEDVASIVTRCVVSLQYELDRKCAV